MRSALLIVPLALLLAGCASSADIKPGVVRGLESGYVKTSEGLALATRGCQEAQLWEAALNGIRSLRVSDWKIGRNRQLTILQADEHAGRIDAAEQTIFGPGSYVGVFLHPPRGDLRLIEVSSFWRTRMTVTENPWELPAIRAIEARLPQCVIPAAAALREAGAFRSYPVPLGRPVDDSSDGGATSALFCRQRANSSAGWDRTRWNEEYRRCMAGY